MMRIVRHFLILLLAAAGSLSAQDVRFVESGLSVTGLDPGSTIAWLQLAHEPEGYITRFVTRDGVARDDDGDGAITVDFETIVPLRSVAVVVNLGSADYRIVTPDGFISVPIEVSERFGRARGLSRPLTALEVERNELEILVVRPRVGAWRLHSLEGSPADSDAANDGVLTARFADLDPLGVPGGAVPGTLKPGDVVVAFDPEDLAHFASRVTN